MIYIKNTKILTVNITKLLNRMQRSDCFVNHSHASNKEVKPPCSTLNPVHEVENLDPPITRENVEFPQKSFNLVDMCSSVMNLRRSRNTTYNSKCIVSGLPSIRGEVCDHHTQCSLIDYHLS